MLRALTLRLAILLWAVAPAFGPFPPRVAHAGETQARETQASKTLVVFAAASLKTALDKVAAIYHAQTGHTVTASYAGSSSLAKQIENGAPADLFVSADTDWMDYLASRKLIDTATRVDLLSNSLVLIAPKSSTAQLAIAPDFPLAAELGSSRLALADTSSVPAGKYAKAALSHFRIWPAIAPKIAEAENVRAALQLVVRDEAAFGIVYTSDAQDEANVRIVDRFPDASHPPIRYPAAVTVATRNAEAAKSFLGFLSSDAAKAEFKKAGFKVLGE